MLEKHRHLLIKFRGEIVEDLLVDDVLPYLRSKFVLDSEDAEVIRKEPTSRRQAEKLLDILSSKGYNTFDHFFTVLKEKYQHLAQLLSSDESSDDENGFNHVTEDIDSPLQLQMMTQDHANLLIANRVEIVEDLLVDDVLNFLQSKMVFDVHDTELIRAEVTSRRQAGKLLDLLETKNDAAFHHFRKALEEPYPHLVEYLQENAAAPRKVSKAKELSQRVDNVLLEGGVPQQPAIFAHRGRDIHKIHVALKSLKERDGWVILHGMAGCGKTVLASEALRSAVVLDECFPGGVHWIRIGPVDQPKLLMHMQNLCARLDSDHNRQPPRNTEEAKDRLRVLFAHQHPRSLLILDDLWDSCDVKFFDVRCRIMVTTRDAAITDMVGGSKAKVHISEGFTEDESLQILAEWTKQLPKTNLPAEAKEIFNLTNGSPLAISMIGALLRDHPTRWEYYVKQLKKKNVSKLKPQFEYQYPTLTEAIRMSINNLPDELRGIYESFAVFHEDCKVPAQVLIILWNEEFEVVEDWMEDLVNKSLARRTVDSEDAIGTWYTVHNLQLTFLHEQATNLEALHKKLVDRYRKVYKGNFSEMKNDGYIHRNLLRHMLRAGLIEEAQQLITDLKWLAAKLDVTGPADLLNDYLAVKGHEDSKELKVINDFHHFVSVNAHRFVEKPLPDLIQMGLSESRDSEVYKQAYDKAIQLGGDGKFYLDWSNRAEESQDTLLITVKIHQGAVYCCSFSQDASKVVSCGADKTVKVWESQSGKELLSMMGHTDVVYCCAFSTNDVRIVSCSADHRVKIWDSSSGKELLTFSGHNQEVFKCMFSPDDKKVVSCSADKTVKVWSCEDGTEYVNFTGHADIVRCCCYSPDGSQIVSCSDDTLVKVWDSTSGQELFTLEGGTTSAVTFCCFKPTSHSIVGVSDTVAKIWDSKTGEELKTLYASSTPLSLAYSQDDSILAVGLSDTTVQLWNTVNEGSIGVYRGHSGWVHCVALSQDASKLVSSSDDETVKIWKVDNTNVQECMKLRMVFDVMFRGDSLTIAITDTSNRLMIFEGENTKLLSQSVVNQIKITSISFNSDGSLVATGFDDGCVKILEKLTCKTIQEFKDHCDRVRWCAFNKGSELLVSVSEDSTAKVYNCVEGTLAFSLEGHIARIQRCMFFHHNQQLVLTASQDGSLKVWNVQSGSLQFSCQHSSEEYVLSCDVSQDDKKLLSASVDKYAKVWDSSTGELCCSFGPHPDVVRSASFSQDNKFICTGCDDGTVRVWNMCDGKKELAVCSKHDAWVANCWFSSNSDLLVSVSNNIKWWKRDGTLCQQFNLKGTQAKSIYVSPDFSTFVSVDNIGTIYVLKRIT